VIRRLPPLSALQSFEAASRMMSFSRAAEELNVTPAAISHQIRMLESRLGIALFRRENNKVLLTDRGQALLPAVREALQMIAGATEQICGRDVSRVVNLSVLPTFAVRWLVPRLKRFQAGHPGIEIRLSTSYRAVDFVSEDYDAAVRYGAGGWPKLKSWRLFNEELVPVCSPALLRGRTLRRPQDLADFTLLHSDTCDDNWRIWLCAAGASNIDPEGGMRFDSCLLTLQAAAEGLGFAAANRAYVEQDLADGRLVAPFEFALPKNLGWHFVCPAALASQPKIVALRSWMLAECGEADPALQ
jgi:LysR family glycine cleavage system transcriptional activator